ncbi:MAG: NAD(P)H-dependent glycerol-3-phosphate dehydrogenase [Sphingopyxis sp.]|nr:NAD(P)H-dependent glycerol-3-phosphate dehydrogenase [Sphingopyxis sp.]
MQLNVGLLGGGSWGTTVAALISRNAPVMLWARDAETVHEINTDRQNSRYLEGYTLPATMRATADMGEAVRGADVLVMGVPSQNFRQVLMDVRQHIRPWVPVISLTKGFELDTGKRMTEVIMEILPGHPVGVLTGPNLAREILQGQAAASVLSMEDEIVVKALQPLFHSGLFRVYTNTDLLGCELGGVLKNVIAIAVGMGDGLGAGDNTRAALMTRGLAEVTRLGVAMGGRPETFAGLAGMGDLIATCTSTLSRNRSVGVELGKGRHIDEVIAEMHMVAEGVKAAPTVVALARQYGVAMPIAQDVLDVTQGRKTALEVFRGLLRANVGAETDAG